jgi:queuosine precursor transporter
MLKDKRIVGSLLLAIYVASVVLANWLTTRFGFISIGLGQMATAGTVAVGGAILVRDFLQDSLGRMAVLAAIVLGAGISYGMSSHAIAVASGVTFLIAETLEFLVYTPLRKRVGWGSGKWSGTVALANMTGALADTLIFLSLAGFPLTLAAVRGQMVGKAYVTVAVILAATLIRQGIRERVTA